MLDRLPAPLRIVGLALAGAAGLGVAYAVLESSSARTVQAQRPWSLGQIASLPEREPDTSGERSAELWAAFFGAAPVPTGPQASISRAGPGEDAPGDPGPEAGVADVRFVAIIGSAGELFAIFFVSGGDQAGYVRVRPGEVLGDGGWVLTQLTHAYVVASHSAHGDRRFSVFGAERRRFDEFLDQAWAETGDDGRSAGLEERD